MEADEGERREGDEDNEGDERHESDEGHEGDEVHPRGGPSAGIATGWRRESTWY